MNFRFSVAFFAFISFSTIAQEVPLEAFGNVNGIPDIVAKIEEGHRWAGLLCRRTYRSPTAWTDAPMVFQTDCEIEVAVAVKRALKAKKLKPADCKEMGIATGQTSTTSEIMTVSMDKPKHPGVFFGKVTDIDEKTLTIYEDFALRINMVVMIDSKTILMNPSRISIGRDVSGYGVQVGSQKVKLTSGASTTIPVIRAMCL